MEIETLHSSSLLSLDIIDLSVTGVECLRKRILVGKFLPEKKTETENGPGFDTTKIMLRKFIFVVFLSFSGHH